MNHKQLIITAQDIVRLGTGVRTGVEIFAEYEGVKGSAWHAAELTLLDEVLDLMLSVVSTVADAAPPWGTVSLNVDPRVIHNGHTDNVISAVEAIGNRTLVLEVLESQPLGDAELNCLEVWRTFGAHVVIDDYGSGLAGPDRLHATSWDGVKLDREYLHDDPAVLDEVAEIAFGHSYIVAEGIETPAQADLAYKAGATHGQGWLYSRPVRIL
jgi:EAL domain-containing protein (putative c-di-GMP-specific phosphodiesterase class I)